MLTAVPPITGISADAPDTSGRTTTLLRRLALLEKDLTEAVRSGDPDTSALRVHALTQQMASVQVQVAQLHAAQRADLERHGALADAHDAHDAPAAARHDGVSHPDPSTPARQAQVWADEALPPALLGAVVDTNA